MSAPIGNKEPDCYFATAVFRRYAGGPDPELVCPPALQLGDNVAALGGDVVKASKKSPKVHDGLFLQPSPETLAI